MASKAQNLCPDATQYRPKLQDPINNLIEAASCRFRQDRGKERWCILIGSPDAFHPVPIQVDARTCRNCVETIIMDRSVFSYAGGRQQTKNWWKRWEASGPMDFYERHPHSPLRT